MEKESSDSGDIQERKESPLQRKQRQDLMEEILYRSIMQQIREAEDDELVQFAADVVHPRHKANRDE